MNIAEKWKEFVSKMNEKGIPVPTIRDPKSGTGSTSLTLVFLSFNIWVVSVVGKWAGQLGGVDSGQCLQMFIACAGLYFGRKFQRDEKGGVTLEGDGSPAEKKEE